MNKRAWYILLGITILLFSGCAKANVQEENGSSVCVQGGEALQEEAQSAWKPTETGKPETNEYAPESELEYYIKGAFPLTEAEYSDIFEAVRLLMEERCELDDVVSAGRGSQYKRIETRDGEEEYLLLDYKGVQSWAEFRSLLERVYAEEYVDGYFVPRCIGETQLFVEYDGSLYRADSFALSDPLIKDSLRIYQMAYWEEIYIVSCELDYAAAQEKGLYIGILRKNSEKPYGYELKMELSVS